MTNENYNQTKGNMEFKDVIKGTTVIFAYRQNNLYDKINEALKEKCKGEGLQLHSIVIPKEVQRLNKEESSNLLKILNSDNLDRGAMVLTDETLPRMLEENNLHCENIYPIDNKIKRVQDNRSNGNSPESYISVLEKIATRSKDLGAENILISLIGRYNGCYGGGMDIDSHGLAIRNKEGKEIIKPIYSNGMIQETFDFLKTPFEKYDLEVIPAMLDYDSYEKKIIPFENCKFETSESKILKLPQIKVLNTKKSAILADRHQSIKDINKDEFKAIFHKHEYASLEERSPENSVYYTPFDIGDSDMIEKIVYDLYWGGSLG